MRQLQVPDEWDAVADYDAIVARMLRARRDALSSHRAALVAGYKSYMASLPNLESLSPMGVDESVAGILRSAIKAGSRNTVCKAMVTRIHELCDDVCPLCDINEADTVDHYLPKEAYAEFSLFAHNLTGACTRCNTTKLEGLCDEQGRRNFLHVYHDSIDSTAEFLVARVSADKRSFVKYELKCDGNMPGFEGHLARHFNKLRLCSRFERSGRRKLLEIEGDLRARCRRETATAKELLLRTADDRMKLYGNLHWQTALYRGAANSDAFIEYALSGERR